METKSLFTSKTLWGVVISLLPTILGMFHLHVTDIPAFTAASTDVVDSIITLVGGGVAVYGRITATKALVVSTKP